MMFDSDNTQTYPAIIHLIAIMIMHLVSTYLLRMEIR